MRPGAQVELETSGAQQALMTLLQEVATRLGAAELCCEVVIGHGGEARVGLRIAVETTGSRVEHVLGEVANRFEFAARPSPWAVRSRKTVTDGRGLPRPGTGILSRQIVAALGSERTQAGLSRGVANPVVHGGLRCALANGDDAQRPEIGLLLDAAAEVLALRIDALRQELTRELERCASLVLDPAGRIVLCDGPGPTWAECLEALTMNGLGRPVEAVQTVQTVQCGLLLLEVTPLGPPGDSHSTHRLVRARLAPSYRRPVAEVLSMAQRSVALLAAEGRTVAEIARTLERSAATVKTHLRLVYQQLEVSNRTELRMALDL